MLYLEGAPDMTQEFRKQGIVLPDNTKVLSITIDDPAPEDSKPEVLNGNTYVPNIAVKKRINVELGQDAGSWTQFFVVGETPSGDLAIGSIKLAGEATPWSPAADAPKPESPEAFVEAWKAAYNAGDTATIVKMYHLEDTPDDFADFALAFAEPWGQVTSVTLAEHVDESRPLNGTPYVPNLTDLKRVEFEGDQSSGAFSIGKTPGGYYAIAGIKRAE